MNLVLNFNAADCLNVLELRGCSIKKDTILYDSMELLSNQVKSEMKLKLAAKDYTFKHTPTSKIKNLLRNSKNAISLIDPKDDSIKTTTYINSSFDICRRAMDLRLLSFYFKREINKYKKQHRTIKEDDIENLKLLLGDVKLSKKEKQILGLS